jgi:hypothetical protein
MFMKKFLPILASMNRCQLAEELSAPIMIDQEQHVIPCPDFMMGVMCKKGSLLRLGNGRKPTAGTASVGYFDADVD